ncbi:MAG: polysaccharide biosynthesis protein [Pyrinomonadaceae bacterium]
MYRIPTNINLDSNPRRFRFELLSKRTQYLLDLVVLGLSFVFAYLLRFDFAPPRIEMIRAGNQLPLVLIIQLAALHLSGVYEFIWRYVGLSEAKKIVRVAIVAAIPLIALRLGLPETLQEFRIPLSVVVMDTVLAFGGILTLRVVRREVYERSHRKATRTAGKRKPVLLIGAGRAGVMTATEIGSRGDVNLEVRGFIDDDPAKRYSMLQGIRVIGTTEDLPRLVRELNIDHVIISIAQASRANFRRILDICHSIPVNVRVIPGLYEILQGKLKVSRIRDVEIEDLLGREPVQLDEKSIKEFLAAKTVMVTGAGGSIGSELARQIACFNPSNILLVERAEGPLFTIDRELRNEFPDIPVHALVADVTDCDRMGAIFASHHPQVVLHAAAHKHVPMMESNIVEAVKNNILGTQRVAKLAGEFGVEVFVLVSTDKAVQPTSIMGATKRIAELVVQDMDGRFDTRYVAVRFGNVIGSAGSVVPIFQDQILNGGPVTVTHPDMVRYFMTIPEASKLVLQAGAIGRGGEIFILDMGEPVRILDLAKQTILLSGLRPHEDIDIVFTGVRPGEKLFEELQTTGEELAKTVHPKIFIGKIAAYSPERIQRAIERFTTLAKRGWNEELRREMHELLPESRLELETARIETPEEAPLSMSGTLN